MYNCCRRGVVFVQQCCAVVLLSGLDASLDDNDDMPDIVRSRLQSCPQPQAVAPMLSKQHAIRDEPYQDGARDAISQSPHRRKMI
jgi:hypothetical protein